MRCLGWDTLGSGCQALPLSLADSGGKPMGFWGGMWDRGTGRTWGTGVQLVRVCSVLVEV